MKVIIPLNVTDSILTSSSIAENDHPQWAGGTTYARGAFVISTATHTVYRSLTAGNVGNDPDVEQAALADPLIDDPDPINWQVISATNRFKMFDKKPSVQATAAEQIEVVLTPGQIVDGIAGFGITAATVTISASSATYGGVIFDRTIAMQDESVVTDWYSYYFTPIARLGEFAVSDIPPYGDAVFTVTFDATGDVGVGQLVIGSTRDLGIADVESGFSGLDFSFVQQDDFGNLTTVRRAATRLSTFEVFCDTFTMLSLDNLLRSLRGGVAAVWIGDDDARKAALNYGFYRDYRVVYKEGDNSLLSLQIQGIV